MRGLLLHIGGEARQDRRERVGLVQEAGMTGAAQHIAVLVPEIAIAQTADVVDVDQRIIGTVDDGDGNLRRLHQRLLIRGLPSEQAGEHDRAGAAVGPLDGVAHAFVGVRPARRQSEHLGLLGRELRFASEPDLRDRLETRLDGFRALCHRRRAADHDADETVPARDQLQRDVAAERPAVDGGLAHIQRLERRHHRIGIAGHGVGGFRVMGVAGRPVPRQVDRDETMGVAERAFQNVAEGILAHRVAVQEYDRQSAAGCFADCDVSRTGRDGLVDDGHKAILVRHWARLARGRAAIAAACPQSAHFQSDKIS